MAKSVDLSIKNYHKLRFVKGNLPLLVKKEIKNRNIKLGRNLDAIDRGNIRSRLDDGIDRMHNKKRYLITQNS